MTDIRDIIGDDVEPGELERLERVHALLQQAGPPPELSPAVEHAPKPPSARVVPFPRRYRYTAVAAAGGRRVRVVRHGISRLGRLLAGSDPHRGDVRAVLQASAELALFEKDTAGNWPMRLRSAGSPPGATSSG